MVTHVQKEYVLGVSHAPKLGPIFRGVGPKHPPKLGPPTCARTAGETATKFCSLHAYQTGCEENLAESTTP